MFVYVNYVYLSTFWCSMSIKLCLGFKDIYTLEKDNLADLNVSFGTNILCNWNIRKLIVHNFRLSLHSFMSSVKNRIKNLQPFLTELSLNKYLINLCLVYKFLYFNIFDWFIIIIFFLLSCFPYYYVLYYVILYIIY